MKLIRGSLCVIGILIPLVYLAYFHEKRHPFSQFVDELLEQSESLPKRWSRWTKKAPPKEAENPPPESSTKWGAISILGEAGFRNLRGSGTYSTNFSDCHRFKISGEYLTQQLSYSCKKRWVSQYAVGGEYQWVFPKSPFRNIGLGSAYSHAFKHDLPRHPIASSDGLFSFLGTTVRLLKCAFLSANANYDHVKYHRKNKALASGWGGSARLIQQWAQDFSFILETDIRKPFNYYEGALNWSHQYSPIGVSCGLFGSYTDGKKGVPNFATGGIRLSLSFGTKKGKCRKTNNSCQCVSTPAVYIPVVLAPSD